MVCCVPFPFLNFACFFFPFITGIAMPIPTVLNLILLLVLLLLAGIVPVHPLVKKQHNRQNQSSDDDRGKVHLQVEVISLFQLIDLGLDFLIFRRGQFLLDAGVHDAAGDSVGDEETEQLHGLHEAVAGG